MTDSMQGLKKKKLKNLENKAENSKGQSSSTLLGFNGDFNGVCQNILNHGFITLRHNVKRYEQELRAKMPLRISDRITHPLA
uniref:Uncharacterized protein n=1 Tax=Daphnia galeata TaxID=27404 RepID=A0A8J2RIT0_9CRUS|nr:unnamed protein product [Daphnia galeata]